MQIVSNNPNPKRVHPFCKVCGWRKGGVDSWDGKRCKCKHEEPAIQFRCVICGKSPVDAENGFDTCQECLDAR